MIAALLAGTQGIALVAGALGLVSALAAWRLWRAARAAAPPAQRFKPRGEERGEPHEVPSPLWMRDDAR